MAAPYVLARTLQEAHTFAQDELGVGRGYYRVVTSPSSIKGIRGTELYVLPGWEGRHDRFAMAGALKWTRLTKIDVAEWRAEREVAPEPDGLEPPGIQLTLISDEEADLFIRDQAAPLTDEDIAELEAILEPEGWEPPETLDAEQILRLAAGESGADVAPAEEPKRRRRRCKECGVLVDPDELEQHNAEHLPSEV